MSNEPQNPGSTTSGHVFKRINKGSGSSKLIEKMLGEVSQGEGLQVNTLGHMVEKLNMTLVFSCNACSWSQKQDPAALKESFALDTPLKDVKISCPKCGSKNVSSAPTSV